MTTYTCACHNEETLSNAEKKLRMFRTAITLEHFKARALLMVATALYKDLAHALQEEKYLVLKGSRTVDQMEDHIDELWQRQSRAWTVLVGLARAEEQLVRDLYKPLQEAEECLKHCEEQSTRMGIFQEDCHVHRSYVHGYYGFFLQAKRDVDALLSFPDGMLLRVELLFERAENERKTVITALRHQDALFLLCDRLLTTGTKIRLVDSTFKTVCGVGRKSKHCLLAKNPTRK